MLWVNARIILILCAAFVASTALAQEAQWRVISKEEKAAVPLFKGQPSPYRQDPVIAETPVEQEYTGPTEKELLALQNRKSAAKLLKEISKLTNGGKGFDPDISRIRVTGLIGTKGDKAVLIAGKWYKVGSRLDVAAKSFYYVRSMIDSLLKLDEAMGKSVLENLEKPLATGAAMELIITRISDTSLHIKDNDGKRYVISFVLDN